MRLLREFRRERIMVPETLGPVVRYDCRDVDTLQLQIKNVGGLAITGFAVGMRACAGGAPQNAHVIVQSANFTTPSQAVPWVSADPASLAQGAECLVTIAVEEIESCEISFAAAGSGTRAVEISAGVYSID